MEINDYEDLGKLDLSQVDIQISVLNTISKELALKYCLMPILENDSDIHIALSDTHSLDAINYVRFLSKKNVIIHQAPREQIEEAIKFHYNRNIAEDALKTLEKENKSAEDDAENRKIIKFVEESPIVKFTNYIIDSSILMNASDVHIEPFADEVIIRLRIDGVLRTITTIDKKIYPNICFRLKVMCNIDTTEKRLPHDGKFTYVYNLKEYDFRVSTIPTIFGEKLVLRLLNKSDRLLDFNLLGFRKDVSDDIKKILNSDHGIILITGPTGSGKTTTLYTMLKEVNNNEKNIVTIEDPVEYNIYGINQINVNNKVGLNFATGLRSILRQDPDIIMIGEIRDEETARIAVRASITGHIVLSTLHTNDAASSVLRIIEMGIPNYLVADAVRAVIAQRLIRKLCPYCKEQYSPSSSEKSMFSLSDNEKIYKAKGCKRCSNTGYHGRTVVFEYMKINSKHRKMIQNNSCVDDFREYNIKMGMKTLKSSCIDMVKMGVTSIEEAYKIIGYD